jgi:UDPglucose 6-dehydrogenase
MKLCVVGTGYVGLVAGACLAEMGNTVICVDKDEAKLQELKNGNIVIYEPGLDILVKENIAKNRLFFSSNLDDAVKQSEVCFITVSTPASEDGSADLSAVIDVATNIAKSMNGYKVIVNKSTVPIGTGDKLVELIKQYTEYEFDFVSNPEFLKQGMAVQDFLRPDRVVIGASSEKAFAVMDTIYSSYLRTGNPLIKMDVKSAEMTKYASNAFLALKISYANEIANICEKVGASSELVRKGMCSDNRIGKKFLFAGLGYGGSCFPKDVKALISVAKENGYDAQILKATDSVNYYQRQAFIEKILNRYNGDVKGKRFALWGLAFKPETNDMREAPAIDIVKSLLAKGASVVAYDPKAMDTAKSIFKDEIEYAQTAYDALDSADALILATEWNEFRNPDFAKIKSMLKDAVIFDGRNQYNKQLMKDYNIEYYCVGEKL